MLHATAETTVFESNDLQQHKVVLDQAHKRATIDDDEPIINNNNIATAGIGSKKQQKRSTNTKQQRKNHSLNLQFIRRLFHVLKYSITDATLARSSLRSVLSALWRFSWFLLLFGCCIGEILIGNEVGRQSGNFTRALLDSQLTTPVPFLKVLLAAAIWIMGAACLKTVRQFVEEGLALSWRSQLVHNIQHLYLQKDMYYKIAVLDQRIDNPYVVAFLCLF